jgi:outer membrane protein OmpA-like peptidoglycan-associated protein
MNRILTFITLSFCFCISILYAQHVSAQKEGMFSFGISLSDYRSHAKDSSLNYGMNQKGIFTQGNSSLGMQISYWVHLIPHIDLSGNLGGDFSNFPALFVKGDSIGQAGFSTHLDGLIHLKAFGDDARVNPFLTAGIGAGYFGKQYALYTPVGVGLQFNFNKGGIILAQLQMRNPLSSGITNDFMFYSIGFAQNVQFGTAKKHESHKDEVIKNSLSRGNDKNNHSQAPKVKKSLTEKGTVESSSQATMDTIASKNEIDQSPLAAVVKENTVSPLPDTDGDGVADKDDKCPDVKGSIINQGCPFPLLEGATVLNMSPDSATYSVSFDFDQSMLQSRAFAVLHRVVEILKSDNTLTINITGHADNQGTDYKNMQVSAERTKVTRDYFLSYNIDTNRIKSSYYGASRPIDKVQQWRNRRVEVTIIKK